MMEEETRMLQRLVNEVFEYLNKYPKCNTAWAYNDNGEMGEATKVSKFVNGLLVGQGEAINFSGTKTLKEAIELTKDLIERISKAYKTLVIRITPRVFVGEDDLYYLTIRLAAFN
jgi:hypothetical protein